MGTFTNGVKSARVFVKNGNFNIDYYSMEGQRKRFSTGMKDNKPNRVLVERQKYVLAQEYIEAHSPSDAKTLLQDIAVEALRSTADERSIDVQGDYESLFERMIKPSLGKMQIGKVRPLDIDKWKKKMIETGMSKSRFYKHWTTLKMIMYYCAKNELIDRNPMDLVKRSSKAFKNDNDNSARYYSADEATAIMKHAKGWFKAFMSTLFMTGMRTGEAIGLKWEYVDFERRKITIAHSSKRSKLKSTKTGTVRVVDMSTTLYDTLLVHYETRLSDVYVFPSPKTRIPFFGANMIVKTYLKPLLIQLKIEYKTLYSTRHSFASNLVATNVPITYVQKMLGHAKLTTTMDFYVKHTLMDTTELVPMLDQMYSA